MENRKGSIEKYLCFQTIVPILFSKFLKNILIIQAECFSWRLEQYFIYSYLFTVQCLQL